MTTANGIKEEADVEELIARIVRKKFPGLALLNVRTYRVIKVYTNADYGRCDLALDSDPEQTIPRVDQWPGIPGGVGLPKVGSLAEVVWRDGDQKSPVIVGFQPSRVTGGIPTETKVDATTIRLGPSAGLVEIAVGPIDIGRAVARVNDTVSLGTLTATAGGNSVTFTLAGGAPASTITLTGTITSGSAKVFSG